MIGYIMAGLMGFAFGIGFGMAYGFLKARDKFKKELDEFKEMME